MRKQRTAFFLLLPLLGVTALVLAACGFVLAQSLGHVPAFGLEELTFSYYLAIFRDGEFLRSLGVSLGIAAASALLAALLGTAVCAALTVGGRKGRGLTYVLRLPILVPHAVVALFTILLFSQTGLLARAAFALGLISDFTQFPQLLYTPGYQGAVAAYPWKDAPLVAYLTLALMSGVSDTLGEAAEDLGASPLRSFFSVTLPLSLPAVCRATLIIFIFAFGGYELPLLLGATVPKALPVEAYLAYMSPQLRDRPYAMAMYGVILALSVAMAALYAVLTRRLLRRMEGSGHE